MLRYFLAAQGLRVFSLNARTRRLYRWLGNVVGGRQRANALPAHYLTRANDNLRVLEDRNLIRAGAHVMEIGTGWAHWEALFMRSFYDVNAVLMDVWDNRQFDGFIRYAKELRERLQELARPAEQISHASSKLDLVLGCRSFAEVYEALGFRYAIGVQEAYEGIADETLDLIFSSDVLEHVAATQVRNMLEQHYRMLKPGGATAHQVVLTDHLGIYDGTVHPKNYLRYSERTWRTLYANEVQYINRLQLRDWRRLFESARFDVEIIVRSRSDVDGLRIAQQFKQHTLEELGVTVLSIIGRKPNADE